MKEVAYSGIDNLEAMKEAVNYRRFLTALLSETRSGSLRAVDFGAGNGDYAKEARGLGLDVLCVEQDVSLQHVLKTHGFVVAPTLDEVPEGSVPLLYTFNVLEHIQDDIQVLEQMFKVMEPGGKLLVYVPAFPLLYSSMDKKVGHVRRYRKKELIEKIVGAGFSVDHARYADSIGFAASLAYRLLGNNRSGNLSPGSVRRYDRSLFPLSQKMDRVVSPFFGKNVVVQASRPEDPLGSSSGRPRSTG